MVREQSSWLWCSHLEERDRYEGEWKMCLKHGTGTDMFSNGDSYTGEYYDGKPEGKG